MRALLGPGHRVAAAVAKTQCADGNDSDEVQEEKEYVCLNFRGAMGKAFPSRPDGDSHGCGRIHRRMRHGDNVPRAQRREEFDTPPGFPNDDDSRATSHQTAMASCTSKDAHDDVRDRWRWCLFRDRDVRVSDDVAVDLGVRVW